MSVASPERLGINGGIIETAGVLPIESMSPAEIIARRIECVRLETIPLSQINIENALVDPSHADELGASMRQKRGQITPIAVRARLDDDSKGIAYDVIDGFHRVAGKKRMGDETVIDATVVYNCPDSELYDLRILAASSVRSVQFPRLFEWITRSWETTPWFQKLTVTQAFCMAVSDAQRSYITDLSSEEVMEIKDWVRTKAQCWGRTVGGTYQMLRVAFSADPELVKRVRAQGGSLKDRIGQITPARLQLVVDNFPGIENYPVQNALMRVSVENRYSTKELGLLIEKVKPLIRPGMSESEIYDLAAEIPIGWLSEKNGGNTVGEVIFQESRDAADFGRGDEGDIAQLKRRVRDLEEALKVANNRTTSPELWWQTAVYLTPTERTLMQEIMYNNRGLVDVAAELKLTVVQALGLIKSAFAKRRLVEPERNTDS
jgi:hypothetical protein